MTRNLKALGLALAAVLTMSAMVASAASAQQGKLTSDGPVTLEMTETGSPSGGANLFTTFGEKVECPGQTHTGHKFNVTPHQPIESGSTTITLTLGFKLGVCFVGTGGLPTTWAMNGCDYVLHIGTTVAANEYALTTDIVCPAGKHIQLEEFNKHPGGIRLCTFTIKPQNGIAGARVITTSASDDLDINGTFGGIHVERSGLCGSATTASGEFHIDVTARGTNSEGAATGITVTD